MSAMTPGAFLLWSAAVALAGLGTCSSSMRPPASTGASGPWRPWASSCSAPGWGARASGPLSASRSRVAAGFGIGATVSAAPLLHALIAGAVAALLAIAVLLAGDPGWERLPRHSSSARRWRRPSKRRARRSSARSSSSASSRHPATGLSSGAALALAVVVVFRLILAEADPVLATSGTICPKRWSGWISSLAWCSSSASLVSAALGGLRHRAAPGGRPRPPAGTGRGRPRLADTERLIVLAAVGRTLRRVPPPAAHLPLRQRPVARGPWHHVRGVRPPGIRRADTVATSARSCWLPSTAGPARGPLEWWRARRPSRSSSSSRCSSSRPSAVFGYTRRRTDSRPRGCTPRPTWSRALSSSCCSAGSVAGPEAGWLARRAAAIAAVAFTVLVYGNHEAWIVRQNLGRFQQTGQLDTGLPDLGALPERGARPGPGGCRAPARARRSGPRGPSASVTAGKPGPAVPLVRVEPRSGAHGGGTPVGRHRGGRRPAAPPPGLVALVRPPGP